MLNSEMRQAKEPMTPLQGPYGHPVHAMLVTAPIGAWVSSLAFDIASRTAGDPTEKRALALGAQKLVGFGILTASSAALFGMLDWLRIPRGTSTDRVGITHMALNSTILLLQIASYRGRGRDLVEQPTSGVSDNQLALNAAAAVLLLASGWLGGEMSYHYGVRVADEATQATGYEGTSGLNGMGRQPDVLDRVVEGVSGTAEELTRGATGRTEESGS